MAARIIAGIVLLGGIAIIAVVGFGGDDAADVVAADAATGDAAAAADDAPVDDAEPGETATTTTASPVLADAPENFGARKGLAGLDGWLNTDISSLDDLDGKVVLVEMWTFGCFNCKARIPHNQELYANLSRDDFEIVGVHAPEFSYEAEIPNIEQAIVDLGVTWPVALDTNKQNFRAWQDGGRRFSPRTYVIDQNGDVRFDHIGEGKYDELEQTINYLIENPPTPAS